MLLRSQFEAGSAFQDLLYTKHKTCQWYHSHYIYFWEVMSLALGSSGYYMILKNKACLYSSIYTKPLPAFSLSAYLIMELSIRTSGTVDTLCWFVHADKSIRVVYLLLFNIAIQFWVSLIVHERRVLYRLVLHVHGCYIFRTAIKICC